MDIFESTDIKIEEIEEGFLIEIPQVVMDAIFNIIDKVSITIQDQFSLPLNIELEEKLVTRFAMARLLDLEISNKIHANNYNKVLIKLPDRTLTASIGYMPITEDHSEFVYGLLYNV